MMTYRNIQEATAIILGGITFYHLYIIIHMEHPLTHDFLHRQLDLICIAVPISLFIYYTVSPIKKMI